MRRSSNSVAFVLAAILAVGCKSDDSSAAKPGKVASEKLNERLVAMTVATTLDGEPWVKPALSDLFDIPPNLVDTSRSRSLLDAVYNLGVASFKAIEVGDASGHTLRIGESILRDSKAEIELVVRETGPTITVENAPPTIDAKGFGTLTSLDISNATFRQPQIDLDSAGTEVVVSHDDKPTPYGSGEISGKSNRKLQRNGREVAVLPLTEIAPDGHEGSVILAGAQGTHTLPWPAEAPIYLYVNRRGLVHALIGNDHARHASGSGRTENKANEGDTKKNPTTIREIATIDFVRKGADE